MKLNASLSSVLVVPRFGTDASLITLAYTELLVCCHAVDRIAHTHANREYVYCLCNYVYLR